MRNKIYCIFLVSIIFMTILGSCKKDPSKVGFEIQPPSEQIELYGNDTIVLFASYTVLYDSVVTSNLSTLVLGSLNDPVFGTTQAAFNTQMRLEKVDPTLGKNVRFDSICLQLAYSGRWGDSTTMLTAHVYRLTDSLWLNSDTSSANVRDNYYAFDQVKYENVPLGSKTFLEQLYDSISLKRLLFKRNNAMHAPFLSIRLSDDFGKELLADSSLFITNTDFLNKYYGLRVAVEPVNGSLGKMLYFSPTSAETKLVLYYTNSDSSTYLNFPINDRCVRFNNYDTDHAMASADLQNQINNPSAASGNQKFFLQPLAGTRLKVDFTGIEKLRGKNIVINEAKLYLNNFEPYNKSLPPPSQLTIYTVSSDGKTMLTLDSELGTTYAGGTFDASNNQYALRITRYLQQRILDPTMDNDKLYISISGASYVANRVVFYGNDPDEGDKKVKIRILASEY